MKTMQDFYKFSSKGYLATFSALPVLFTKAIDNKEFDKAGKVMDDLIRGNYEGYNFPLEFRPGEQGTKFRDVLDTRYVAAYMISDRMKNLLEEHGITGWKTYPIELYDRKKNLITGYNGFSIVGHAGPMDMSNQPVGERPWWNGKGADKYYLSSYFDVNTWDGSDFFILDDSRYVIVTERVVDLLKKNKVTALEFKRLSEMALPYSLFNKE